MSFEPVFYIDAAGEVSSWIFRLTLRDKEPLSSLSTKCFWIGAIDGLSDTRLDRRWAKENVFASHTAMSSTVAKPLLITAPLGACGSVEPRHGGTTCGDTLMKVEAPALQGIRGAIPLPRTKIL